MRRILSSRPSPAMVVACIALVVALGGTGYAAIKLPRNSVGPAQLRANSVTSGKVRNGSLTPKDFNGSLPRGPRGPQGPKGDAAAGAGSATPRAAFATREVGGAPIAMATTSTDVVGLGVPAGSAGYVASSGSLVVDGPSRLVANAQAVMVNGGPAPTDVECRLVVIGSDARLLGGNGNANIASVSYLQVSASGGLDVEAGTYDVRLQCFAAGTGVQFHRGNLTVTTAPR